MILFFVKVVIVVKIEAIEDEDIPHTREIPRSFTVSQSSRNGGSWTHCTVDNPWRSKFLLISNIPSL